MRRYKILLIAIGLMLGADDSKKDSGADELKKLQGQWTVESLEANGEKLPADEAKKMKLTIKDNNWTLDRGDDTTKGTIKLAPTKNPKEFDALLEGSSDAVLGLYEIKGDTLKMCWTNPGGERPSAFKGDDGKTLVVYKKAKSD
jgi:uncharacterized protein (TIGR03067 family)